MTFLLTQIFLCLVVAALIGGVAAWFLRRNMDLQREEAIQRHWKDRIRQIELDRDRNVHKLNAEIERVKKSTTQSGQNAALADYESLTSKLQEQVAEREDVIGELRSEVQSLRTELADAWASARQRESDLLEHQKQETANLVAALEQSGQQDASERESSMRRQHEQQVADLTARLSQQKDAALSEQEQNLRADYEQALADLGQQLAQAQSADSGESLEALRQQHEAAMSELVKQLEQDKDHALRELEQSLRAEQEQALAGLKTQLSEAQSAETVDTGGDLRRQYEQQLQQLESRLTQEKAQVLSEQERALHEEHKQALADLKTQLAQAQSVGTGEDQDAVRRKYEQEMAGRTAQLLQQKSQALNEQAYKLREQYEQEIADLKTQVNQLQDESLVEPDVAVRQRHEQELAVLTKQLAAQEKAAIQKRERELLQQHAQEMDRLRNELQQRDEPAADEERINELLAEIQLRDDSIAVLRNDLAELGAQHKTEQHERQDEELRVAVGEARAWQEKHEAAAAELNKLRRTVEQSQSELTKEWQEKYEAAAAELRERRRTEEGGQHDAQLRSAIDESIYWQEKYEAAAAKLSRLSADKPVVEKTGPAMPANLKTATDLPETHRVSGGDRIGSALAHPGGHRDWLQEIKGIGPAIARKLNDVGIYHFKQIAEFDTDDIARISNELGSFSDRIVRDDWIGQARVLHKKYHD